MGGLGRIFIEGGGARRKCVVANPPPPHPASHIPPNITKNITLRYVIITMSLQQTGIR
jgi:hypothetical protein